MDINVLCVKHSKMNSSQEMKMFFLCLVRTRYYAIYTLWLCAYIITQGK